MGLFSFTLAGAGFILIGAWESLRSSSSTHAPNSSQSSIQSTKHLQENPDATSSSSLTYAAVCIFSFLFIADSLLSLFNAVDSHDGIGSALQLQILSIAAVFLLYSLLGLLTNLSLTPIRFPTKLLDLILLFGFLEEFLLYYLQKKDTAGIENRYFDLMLVPISICLVSTLLELKSNPEEASNYYPRLARGVGLILQGTWFVQMGISFYSVLIVQGCSLRARSRGNYTITCKGHHEIHRANGIATLQFNCHLALLVLLASALYSSIVNKAGYYTHSGERQYNPIGAEMLQMESGGGGRFTLDSDEDEIREEEENGDKEAVLKVGLNGYGSHE
ncbi:hypothetical protein LINGRAHAP2_LOCUS6786 [Linum grandiflorum]